MKELPVDPRGFICPTGKQVQKMKNLPKYTPSMSGLPFHLGIPIHAGKHLGILC